MVQGQVATVEALLVKVEVVSAPQEQPTPAVVVEAEVMSENQALLQEQGVVE
jgi:hypothetical protein